MKERLISTGWIKILEFKEQAVRLADAVKDKQAEILAHRIELR
jgi:hypothetical protein